MKKLTLLTFLGLVLIFGCAEDQITPISTDADQIFEEGTNAFVLEMGDASPVWHGTVVIEKPTANGHSNAIALRTNNGNSAHSHGDFPGVEYSATENAGGTHGGAELNLGPLTFITETACVMIEGNVATYGGTITGVAGPPFPYGVGDKVFFRVIDNGQGSGAASDQFTGAIRFRFSFQPEKCGVWTPSHPVWSNFPDFDVPEPGSIKVNN